LLPSALQDWLPEGHLAYHISDGVDTPDPSAFHARYAGGGPRNRPFHPAMFARRQPPLAHARNLGHPNTSPTLTPTLSRQRERGNFIRRDLSRQRERENFIRRDR
jgi:hypothetical protein